MVNEENERRAFEYHVKARLKLGDKALAIDPDSPGNYAEQYVNALWAGWKAGVSSYAKRKG